MDHLKTEDPSTGSGLIDAKIISKNTVATRIIQLLTHQSGTQLLYITQQEWCYWKKISLIFYAFPSLWPILDVSSSEYTSLPALNFALKNYYQINKYILHIHTPRTEGVSSQKVAKVVTVAAIMRMTN